MSDITQNFLKNLLINSKIKKKTKLMSTKTTFSHFLFLFIFLININLIRIPSFGYFSFYVLIGCGSEVNSR